MHVSFAGRGKKSEGRWPGFTLVELLVVIGAVSVLIAILLPAMHSVREQGRGVLCMSHQRQLWQGFVTFAAEHDGRLPGDMLDFPAPYPDGGDWLAGPAPEFGDPTTHVNSYDSAPQRGTLFKYVNNNYAVYRCPSLEASDAAGFEIGSGAGSNGRFDYVAFSTFAGVHLHRVPRTCTFKYNGAVTVLPTPIVCEEEAGTLNGVNMEGCHCWWDKLGHQHRGGCYYASPDGAVNWFSEPLDADARNWWVAGPTGSQCDMGYPCNSGYFEIHGKKGFNEFGS